MKKTNEKGITLVALIITVIVMLILLAVVININIDTDITNTAAGYKNNINKQENTLNDIRSEIRDLI